jgi:hypothetical protein
MSRLTRLVCLALATLCLSAAGRVAVDRLAHGQPSQHRDPVVSAAPSSPQVLSAATAPEHPDRPMRRARGTGPSVLGPLSERIAAVGAFVRHAMPSTRRALQASAGGSLARSARAPPHA